VVLDESGKPKDKISITNPPVTIGRLSANDVVLSDPNVSRRHAELRLNGDRWVVTDLGSTNGTSVNDKLAREQTLNDGDMLAFGSSRLRFELSGG
jgi:pSer/pThr/pTyr-binding forkhead associated (FHA) protein